jgi:hypothetical protein
MIQGLIRYLVFILVATALVYGGYRMLTPATTKTTATEKAEKEEHSDSVVLSDAKVAAAGIELAKASPGVLRDSLLLKLIPVPETSLNLVRLMAAKSTPRGAWTGPPSRAREDGAEKYLRHFFGR